MSPGQINMEHIAPKINRVVGPPPSRHRPGAIPPAQAPQRVLKPLNVAPVFPPVTLARLELFSLLALFTKAQPKQITNKTKGEQSHPVDNGVSK